MAEQLIYLEVGDGIARAVERLRQAKHDEVVMVIPRRALLLQSAINLKILKRQADMLGKTVSLVSRDEVGRNFAAQAGFKVLEKFGGESEADAGVVKISSASPSPDASTDKSTVKYKPRPRPVSYLNNETEPTSKPSSVSAIRSTRTTQRRLKLERHHQTFIGFVVLGLIVLGSVAFFVLPRAYVVLEVQSEAVTQQFTLTLVDEQDLQAAGPNVLTGRFVEVTRESVSTFDATGEENKGQKAEGKIVIVNHTGTIQGLVVNTRFQSSAGLVFRIKNEILVPPARSGTPGRATVSAVADGGGTKYNVAAPLRLTIPGLGSTGIDLVYGEVSGSFSGGSDDITLIVSEEDIKQSKEEASKNVFVAAETQLRDQLQRDEELLPELIQNDVIDVVPSVNAGAKKEQFEMRVQSRSWVILVNRQELAQAIANAAAFEVPEGQQVTQQTIQNAQIEVVESSFLSHNIKLLIALDGRAGPQLSEEEITTNLTNKSIAEGVTWLQTLPDAATASIEIWPTFLNRIPLLSNNVRLQIIYLGE